MDQEAKDILTDLDNGQDELIELLKEIRDLMKEAKKNETKAKV